MAKDLNEQAHEILKLAENQKIEQDFFFKTTFRRYQVQLKLLNDLEKEIKESGLTITKEYVKGRQNLCSNPAVGDYNKTADAANRTVTTLMNIIIKLQDAEPLELSNSDDDSDL